MKTKFDRNNLSVALANYEKNMNWLQGVPHRRIADLALYVRVKTNHDQSYLVTNGIFSGYGITEEELFQIAMENTANNYGLVDLKTMMEALCSSMNLNEDTSVYEISPFLILTTKDGAYGASLMAIPEVMKRVRKEIGEDFYILPSSVHEVLIVPVTRIDSDDPVRGLKEIVESVNGTEVDPKDQLSNNIYKFDGETIYVCS